MTSDVQEFEHALAGNDLSLAAKLYTGAVVYLARDTKHDRPVALEVAECDMDLASMGAPA